MHIRNDNAAYIALAGNASGRLESHYDSDTILFNH